MECEDLECGKRPAVVSGVYDKDVEDDGGHRMGRGKETVIMTGYCEEDGDQEADILDMETDEHGIPGCDKYNVHGVKLEHNCFI